MVCTVILHAFDAGFSVEQSVVVKRRAPVMIVCTPAEPTTRAGGAARPERRVRMVMHGPMAMVMRASVHVNVTSRAVQHAMMATRSVMASGCMVTPRSMKSTGSMMTATMRLCLGRDSQADGAHQEECNQELSKDVLLLSLIWALSRRTLSLRSLAPPRLCPSRRSAVTVTDGGSVSRAIDPRRLCRPTVVCTCEKP